MEGFDYDYDCACDYEGYHCPELDCPCNNGWGTCCGCDDEWEEW